MNGAKFHRLRQHRSRVDVAKAAGLCEGTIRKLEEESAHQRECKYYMRVAAALGVTVDDLLIDYPEDFLEPGDQYVRPSTVDSRNCIEAWRRDRNLNYEQVAQILALASRESARAVCRNPMPKLCYIKVLAKREDMTIDAFLAKYDGWEVEA